MTKKVKEKMGLLYGVFAPIISEPEDALPLYGAGTSMGAMSKANLSVTTTDAKLYGDDALQVKVDSFVSGSLAVENLRNTLENDAVLFGSTMGSDGVSVDKDTDEPPLGAFGYIQKLMDEDKVLFYRAVWLTKVQAQMGDDNSDSKQDKLTFANNAVAFEVMRCSLGAWRFRTEYYGAGAEASAKSWLDGIRVGAIIPAGLNGK